MNPSTKAGSDRGWRQLRISVRALVVAVMLIGGTLGWWVRGVRLQREAVEAIQKAGGYVTYDWAYKNGEIFEKSGPPWPVWVVDLLGVDCFSSVTRISLDNARSDQVLAPVTVFSQLEDLGVSRRKDHRSRAGLSRGKKAPGVAGHQHCC